MTVTIIDVVGLRQPVSGTLTQSIASANHQHVPDENHETIPDNSGLTLLLTAATLLGPLLGMPMPLLPLHILWINC